YYRQSQAHHLLLEVQRTTVSPSLACASRIVRHDRSVRGDAIAMEGRLGQLPLTAVEIVFARQQPLAQKALCHLEPAALMEYAAVGNQNVADIVGMVDQVDALAAELEWNYITIVSGQTHQEAKRVPAKRNQQAAGKPLHGTGRRCG